MSECEFSCRLACSLNTTSSLFVDDVHVLQRHIFNAQYACSLTLVVVEPNIVQLCSSLKGYQMFEEYY